ncbi:hypothetical protein LXL04_036134 [Taraxacum kok-saghyz]
MAVNVDQEFVNTTGMEIVPYSPCNDQEQEVDGTDMIIDAEPLASFKPDRHLYMLCWVEGSEGKKRKRKTSTELDEEIKKDFTLYELFKFRYEDIENINRGKEIRGEPIFDPQELLKNINGWTIVKRKRGGNEKRDLVIYIIQSITILLYHTSYSWMCVCSSIVMKLYRKESLGH